MLACWTHYKTRIFLNPFHVEVITIQIGTSQHHTTSSTKKVKVKIHILLSPCNADVWVNFRRRSTHYSSRHSLGGGEWSAPCFGCLSLRRVLCTHRTVGSARPKAPAKNQIPVVPYPVASGLNILGTSSKQVTDNWLQDWGETKPLGTAVSVGPIIPASDDTSMEH
jgi:hypothetical protein